MKKYLIFDLDGTLTKSNKLGYENVMHFIKKIDENYIEKAENIFKTTTGLPTIDQLKLTFDDKKDITEEQFKKLTGKIYKRFRKKIDEVDFFDGIPEKIKEVSKDYKLFLTTGNSTKFAKKIFKSKKIKNCFELIYGSDEIKKGFQHLSIFKNYSEDKDFFSKSLYFGDGEADKIFAKEVGIDFVGVGDYFKEEKYFIESVADIDEILKLFK